MKFTLEQLKQTKVGQMPSNQAALAQTHKHAKPITPVGGLLPQKPKPNPGSPLVQAPPREQKGKRRVVVCVTIVRVGVQELDDDNLRAAFKALRDSIATSIGVADNDRRVRWQYGQATTQGQTGTIVTIELKHR